MWWPCQASNFLKTHTLLVEALSISIVSLANLLASRSASILHHSLHESSCAHRIQVSLKALRM